MYECKMPVDSVKRILEKMTFRDAVLLHNELLTEKPLSDEAKAKLHKAIRLARMEVEVLA